MVRKKKDGIYRKRYSGGYYGVVVLDGKIRERRKIKKGYSLQSMREHYKSNNTINPNRKLDFIKRNDGGTTTEITEYKYGSNKRLYRPKGMSYQYVISADVMTAQRKYKHVAVRSNKYTSDYPVATAKEDAETKFYRVISYEIYQDSRHGVSAETFDRQIKNYKEGIVYYKGVRPKDVY